jgi:hypothetical protein
MSTTADAMTRSVTTIDRNFYLSMGIVCALFVFIGFSPTYFLSVFFERPANAPPLSLHVHIHTAIFTGWFALYITQSALVRNDRRDLHRRLGILGLVLAIALVTINIATVVNAISEGRSSRIGPPMTQLYVALSSSLIVAGFIAAGMYFRKSRDIHKRLMLLATIAMVGPALNRIIIHYDLVQLLGVTHAAISGSVVFALIGAGIVNDVLRSRRVHPVYLVGFAIQFGLRPLGQSIPRTETWETFAKWVLS